MENAIPPHQAESKPGEKSMTLFGSAASRPAILGVDSTSSEQGDPTVFGNGATRPRGSFMQDRSTSSIFGGTKPVLGTNSSATNTPTKYAERVQLSKPKTLKSPPPGGDAITSTLQFSPSWNKKVSIPEPMPSMKRKRRSDSVSKSNKIPPGKRRRKGEHPLDAGAGKVQEVLVDKSAEGASQV